MTKEQEVAIDALHVATQQLDVDSIARVGADEDDVMNAAVVQALALASIALSLGKRS